MVKRTWLTKKWKVVDKYTGFCWGVFKYQQDADRYNDSLKVESVEYWLRKLAKQNAA